jgi:hypothetical protein
LARDSAGSPAQFCGRETSGAALIRCLTWVWATMVILGFIVAIGYDLTH